ncbi:MAG: helix-turn-helix transcriptional regulator [Bacteroidota bacterium]
MKVGYAIRKLRVGLNVSQRSFARSIGISQTSLSQIENGFKHPNAKTVRKVCDHICLPAELLFLLAIDETQVPEDKKAIYICVQPAIMQLVMKIIR